ncbi:hypothetical protein EI94DRAFT_1734056 [Lactarius quietus]|nr:hypothetical protein EI94DRAFT_1734056 [Lactarius quietus]
MVDLRTRSSVQVDDGLMPVKFETSSSWKDEQQAIDAETKLLEESIQGLKESIQALKHRRNILAPFSSLPPEVIAKIFSFLHLPSTSPSSALPQVFINLCSLSSSYLLSDVTTLADHRNWLHATHVCHQWREIALNDPLFWSHIDFTNLTPAGAAEILARAKTMPLHLEARDDGGLWRDDVRCRSFEGVLQSRDSHISHLSITARPSSLRRTFDRLASPAPTLEHLSLSQVSTRTQVSVPDTLFDGTTPRLSRLELCNCDISWNSPLLKGLRYLEIRTPSKNARPSLTVWLDVLDEMPQLKELVLHTASPIAPTFPFDIERTVTLPSLTYLDISTSAKDCALALAHLALPALTGLCLVVDSLGGDVVQNMFPYVAQHADGPQDTQPLRSMLIYHQEEDSVILAWPMPYMHVELDNQSGLLSAVRSARVALFVRGGLVRSRKRYRLLDAAMTALPLDSLVTLTADYDTPLHAEFWLRHTPKWPLLQCVQLAPPEADGFGEMLLQDDGGCEFPLLPSLTELILIDVALTEHRTLRLCDALMKRVEQEVPVEKLDLSMCYANSHAVRLLSESAVDVCEPLEITEMSPTLGTPVHSGSLVSDSSSEGEDYSDDWEGVDERTDVEEEQESEDFSEVVED